MDKHDEFHHNLVGPRQTADNMKTVDKEKENGK
jgi:hypothetical protein